MMPSRARRSLSAASVLVLALLALHCGGKVIRGGGAGGGGAGSSGGAGGGPSGGGGGSPGTNCPGANLNAPPEVMPGGVCDWGGSCFVAVPGLCTPETLVTETCDCVGGTIQCPPIAMPCPSEICPAPAAVGEGIACSTGGLRCPGTITESCGGMVGHANVHCVCGGGRFVCPSVPCPPPPPQSCAAGASCDPPGSSCTLPSGGVCGGARVFTCQSNGTYDNGIDPCMGDQSCAGPGGEVCFCYPDPTSIGHYVCGMTADAGKP
jgi:hypothetical protein